MKIFLITSNKYTHVCPINIHFLNKYWPNQEIVLLGYEEVSKLQNLPENVVRKNLGTQNDFGTSWTNGLIPFFNNIEDEYFIILLDDLIVLNEVDLHRINLLEEQFKSGDADKAMIGGGLPLQSSTKINEELLLFNQGVDYRCSLHPAIWTKEYFLKYLRPNLSPWEFEMHNNNAAKGDGYRVIANNYRYPAQQHPFSILNLYNKGKLMINNRGDILDNQPSKRFFNKEDLIYIWEKLNAS
tara:strand:- start:21665 stop:22387 length:723 start_codon:yes stop_codon:yes gene_type:complete